MLDMGLPISSESEVACTDAINALGVDGLLLQSGRSYHFIGDQLLSAPEMAAYLARAQLLPPSSTRDGSHISSSMAVAG